jgi:hypothetical protein
MSSPTFTAIALASRRISILVAFACFCAAASGASARDASWELQQRETGRETGFELYQRDVEDSSYDRYRLEAVVDEPLERVIRAVQVRRSDDRYLGEGIERRFLEIDENASVSYIRMKISMVKDRDVALKLRWGFDSEHGVYRDSWQTANEFAPPVPNGTVRMAKSEGFWELKPIGEGRTLVVYESHAEPGGVVPGWIANSIFGNQIVGQIVTLRRILADQRVDVASPPPNNATSAAN